MREEASAGWYTRLLKIASERLLHGEEHPEGKLTLSFVGWRPIRQGACPVPSRRAGGDRFILHARH
jgi:hypothetical protein